MFVATTYTITGLLRIKLNGVDLKVVNGIVQLLLAKIPAFYPSQ